MSDRGKQEILHGEYLAATETEAVWGWGTPAGRVRAKRRAQLIIDGARLNPDSHILEIGCGTGMFTGMFASTRCSIVAVDISEALLEKAKSRLSANDNVRFLCKRFEDCEMEGPFDAVIGSSILHHLELKQALPEIYQLLKPGGILCIAEPNMLNPQVFVERKLRRLFPYVSPDETAFVRWVFKKDLQEAGFRDIFAKPFDWLHPQVPEQMISLVSGAGKLIENVPLVREFSGSLYIEARRPTN